MPVARYGMPDGSVARIQVPDGTTPEQAQKMFDDMVSDPSSDLMKAYSAKTKPAESSVSEIPQRKIPAPATRDVVVESLKRVPTGIAESFAQAPENIMNLAKMAYGTGAALMGRPELAPEVEMPPARIEKALTERGYLKSLEGMTPSQQMLSAAVQGAGAGLIQPVSGAKQIAANILKGAVAGGAGEAVTQATGSELAGIATSMLAPGILTKTGQLKKSALEEQRKLNAVRDQTIKESMRSGYVIPPGEISPSAKNVLLESIAGKTALEQVASVKNQKVTNKLARQAVGIAKDAPLTAETMQNIRKAEYQKGYAPLRDIGQIGADVNYMLDLNKVMKKSSAAGRSFPGADSDEVRKLVSTYSVNNFDSGDALDAIKLLREQSSDSFRKGETGLARAQKDVANALERQIERHLVDAGDPDALEKLSNFKSSRQRMAISHVVEDAINKGEGTIDAKELAKMYRKDKYLSGELETIAKFANTFPKAAQAPSAIGTPAANKMQAGIQALRAGGLGTVAGGVVGGVPGAVAGAAIPFAARQYMTSGLAQQRAIPTYQNRLAELAAQKMYEPALMSTLLGLQAAKPTK